METVEQNTSKQVSAKKTALQNMYKYSKFFFFFLKQSECREIETRNWNKDIFRVIMVPV